MREVLMTFSGTRMRRNGGLLRFGLDGPEDVLSRRGTRRKGRIGRECGGEWMMGLWQGTRHRRCDGLSNGDGEGWGWRGRRGLRNGDGSWRRAHLAGPFVGCWCGGEGGCGMLVRERRRGARGRWQLGSFCVC